MSRIFYENENISYDHDFKYGLERMLLLSIKNIEYFIRKMRMHLRVYLRFQTKSSYFCPYVHMIFFRFSFFWYANIRRYLNKCLLSRLSLSSSQNNASAILLRTFPYKPRLQWKPRINMIVITCRQQINMCHLLVHILIVCFASTFHLFFFKSLTS